MGTVASDSCRVAGQAFVATTAMSPPGPLPFHIVARRLENDFLDSTNWMHVDRAHFDDENEYK